MKTIQKTVTINGVKTKVSFKTKHVKTTVLIDNQEIANNPKKTGIFRHFESIVLFIINGVNYEVKKEFIQQRVKIMKDRSYKEVYTYNSFSVANNEKKMIEHILSN